MKKMKQATKCVSDIFKMKQATKCGVSDIFWCTALFTVWEDHWTVVEPDEAILLSNFRLINHIISNAVF
jgi:hypothetical protein